MGLMLLVHADGVAHGSVCGGRCVLGSVGARSKLLLVHQIMIPVILLPLGVHDEHRWATRMIAESGQFEQES